MLFPTTEVVPAHQMPSDVIDLIDDADKFVVLTKRRCFWMPATAKPQANQR